MSNVLYFFTTTLNFGNYLSSAAVYPPSFYGSSPFLYKTGYSFLEQKDPSVLLLYKKPPIFKINSTESNHAPLLLEIDRKILREELLEEHSDFFSYSGEIFLTPEAVRFIFFDEDSRKESLERTEKNLVCKFDRLFGFEVITPKSDRYGELNPLIEGGKFWIDSALEETIRGARTASWILFWISIRTEP